jgi:hypothetical protein
MTDQLTQEEAERCAKACEEQADWDNGHVHWINFPMGPPRDPNFWFPRLWERRKELEPVVRVGLWPNNSLAGDCIDFCAAIELLTVAK